MPLMGSSVDRTQPRKESVILKICQYEFPNWKTKRGKKNNEQTKQPQGIHELWDDYKMCNICIMGISEEGNKTTEEVWSNNSWKFSKLDNIYQTTDP